MGRVLATLTLALVLGMTQAAAASPSGDDYQENVMKALRPALMPLAVKWAKEKYGPQAEVTLRFISLHRSGSIQVHIDIEAPNRTCVVALFFKWQDGWRLTEVDNHSGSASGC